MTATEEALMSRLQTIRRRFGRPELCFLIAILLMNGVATAAEFFAGDVFLNNFQSSSRLIHYRSDGSIVQIFQGTGGAWEGASITPDRRIVTTRRSPVAGINIFDADGNEVTFDTPQLTIPGDVSVFSDGTLAVSNQSGSIELFTLDGHHLGSIAHETLTNGTPFGSSIGPDDTLWVATFASSVPHFSKGGAFLGSLTFPFQVQELAVDPSDGTLWIPDSAGLLHNFSTNGEEQVSFQTAAVPPFLRGVAVGPDGTLYVTSQFSTSIFHYSRQGMLLGTISIGVTGGPVFMSIFLVPEPSTATGFFTGLIWPLWWSRRKPTRQFCDQTADCQTALR